MSLFYIAIVNHSTVLTDEEVAPVVAALKKQVNEHFAPHYGIQADVRFFNKTTPIQGHWWPLLILDNSDQAGVLGYHDLAPNGNPLGKVFAATDKAYGMQFSCTLSHEILELISDPLVNTCASQSQVVDASGARVLRFFALECCDPCQQDSDGYLLDGVLVSNFVLPRWFRDCAPFPPSGNYDFLGNIKAPFELLPGGYISVYDSRLGHGWYSLNGSAVTNQHRAPVGSRRERRAIPRDQWVLSNPKIPIG